MTVGLVLMLLFGASNSYGQTVAVASVSAQCNGNANGAFTFAANGGTMSAIQISPVAGTTSIGPAGLYAQITGLAAGTYNLTVTFTGGSTYSDVLDISEPDPLFFSLDYTWDCANSEVIEICAYDGSGTQFDFGGTAPYDFTWLDGSNQQVADFIDVNSLPCINSTNTPLGSSTWLPLNMNTYAGDVELYVYDDNNCFYSQTKVFTPPVIGYDMVVNNASCVPGSDGSLEVINVTGGSGIYTYAWSNGVTTALNDNLNPGSYTVTITDTYGCASGSIMGTIPEANQLQITGAVTNVSCFGGNDGEIVITVSDPSLTGPAPTYFFQWAATPSTNYTAPIPDFGLDTQSGLFIGTYFVNVSDPNTQCLQSASFGITEPTDLVAGSASVVDESCVGAADGSVIGTASGGVPPYTYELRYSNLGTVPGFTPTTDPQFVNIPFGSYRIFITDANNCNAESAAFVIDQPAAITLTSFLTQVDCYGSATGSIIIAPGGGTQPYSYLWSNGVAGQNLTGVVAGTYTVTVTDANGCTAITTETLVDPQLFTVGVDSVFHNICHGDEVGRLYTTITGGTPSYTWSWTVDGAPIASATDDLINLGAGDYCLTVVDGNGCQATVCEIVNEPPPLTIEGQVEMISCNGTCDGEVKEINATGGTAPYLYQLNNSFGAVLVPYQTNDFFDNLCDGTYNILVKDGAGCISPYPNWTIVEPDELEITFVDGDDVSCFAAADGFVDITITGGTLPYDIEWSNGATTADLSNLGPGTYSLTVTDANDCVDTYQYVILEPAQLTLVGVPTDILCNGGTDGAIDITLTGGTAPYTYAWTSASAFVEDGTTHDLSALVADDYSLLVTDANGCTDSGMWTISEPALLDVSVLSFSDVGCNSASDGAITIAVAGGTPAYSYAWEVDGAPFTNYTNAEALMNLDAGTYCVTITDVNNCTAIVCQEILQPVSLSLTITSNDITCCGADDGSATVAVTGGTAPYSILWNTAATGNTISGLSAGTYTVDVIDANSCTGTASVTIVEPPCLSGTLAKVDVTCFGMNDGSLTLAVTGGTPAYSYNWTVPAGFTGDPEVDNLIPGDYCVTVTDANGCEWNDCITIMEPALLDGTLTHTDITCCGANDGTLSLSVTGGTPTYAYNWSVPAGFTGDPMIDNLVPGDYCVTVTDMNNCTWNACVTVMEPLCLTGSLVATDITCYGSNDGTLTLSYSGGTAPYTVGAATLDGNPYAGTVDGATNLAAGEYCVTITDANGCMIPLCATVNEPVELTIDAVKQDILCFGSTDGHITVSVTAGGVGTISYAWTVAGLAEPTYDNMTTITGLGAAEYCVTATDINGCMASDCETIIEPVLFEIDALATDVSCFGSTDGSISFTTTGGTPPQFIYMNGILQTQSSFINMAPNTYNINVYDDNGCLADTSLVINEPALVDVTGIVTNVSCNLGADGSIDVTVLGGTAPYTYSWTGSSTFVEDALTHDLSMLAAGTYTLDITDANGCTGTETFTVNEPSIIDISGQITNVLCNGALTGAIDVTITGGSPLYTIDWEDALANPLTTDANGEDVSGLAAGVYYLVVTDQHGCDATESFTINEPPALTLSGVVGNASCSGTGDGTITLTLGGGVPSYSFLWSDGSTSGNRSGLMAGSYSVTVTDMNGCTISDSWTVDQPISVNLVGVTTDVSCFGWNDGTVDITVTGGTAPYVYNWSSVNAFTEDPTTHDLSMLIAGDYALTVTDVNGCSTSDMWTISQPDAIVLTPTVVDVDCNGMSTGSISLVVTGGTGSYTFDWSDNISFSSGLQNILNIPAGTYHVTVTDASVPGCDMSATYTVTQPDALMLSGVVTNVNCNGDNTGAIDITVVDGTMPYTYTWSSLNTFVEDGTTHDLSMLAAGDYSLTVTDANGCTVTDMWTITEPADLDVTAVTVDVDCYGNSTGTLDVTVTGGATPYTYNWSSANPFVEDGTTHDLSMLAAGEYFLTVTDANQCVTFASWDIFEPTELTIPVANLVITQMTMFGANDGAMTVTPVGGTMPYTYLWDYNAETGATITNLGVGTYCVTVTDANMCTVSICGEIYAIPDFNITIDGEIYCNGLNDGWVDVEIDPLNPGVGPYTYIWNYNGETTQDLSGLPGGTYSVTATDANGDMATASITLVEPPMVTVTLNDMDVTCNGFDDGSIVATPAGGTAPYTYMWSNGMTSASISGLAPMQYCVTVYDAYMCEAILCVDITEPPVLEVNPTLVNPVCNGDMNGSITLNATGGTAPLTFVWTGPAAFASTDENITALMAGTYYVTVTDANGCMLMADYTLTEPTAVVASISSYNDVVCYNNADGTITAMATGGTPTYTYLWSNGETTSMISNLAPGTYTVTVTDMVGCTAEVSQMITQPDMLVASAVATHIICNGDNNGTVTGSAVGGTAPYTYVWSGPAGTLNGDYQQFLIAGTYCLTVTDANQCTSEACVTITEASALMLDITSTDLLCLNGNEGSVSLTVTGGQAPYVFVWEKDGVFFSNDEDLNTLEAGQYCVTVTDDFGCTAVICADVNQPQYVLEALYITGENVDCYGADNGWFEVMATGGQPPYQYSLDYAPFTAFTTLPQVYSNLTPGFHLLTIGDANNCEIFYEIEITEPDTLELSFTWDHNACYGDQNGWIDMTIMGGTLTEYLQTCTCDSMCHEILWSNGATTEDISGLAAGTYEVTVTDCNGCIAIGSVTITEPSAIILSETHGNLNCYGVGNGWIDLMVSGGTAPYTYAWNNGATSMDLIGLSGGWYTVTVTDANACTAAITVLITEPSPFDLDFETGDIMCTGDNDGWIDLLLQDSVCLQYNWSNGATTQDISGLAAGWYYVTVIDCNGCMAIDSACIYAPNNPLEIDYTVNDVLCYGGNTGSIDISAVGGTMPYLGIYWTGVVPTECCGLDTIVLDSAQMWGLNQTTDILADLQAGTYYVTLVDAYNCEAYAEIIVEQPSCPLEISNYSVTDIDMNVPGEIDIYVCCGTFPYTYYWEYEGAFYSNDEDLVDVAAGSYAVTVTDANGCQTTGSYVIGTSAYPAHWTFEIGETSHTIFIPTTAVPTLSIGDYIGVFYDSLGTLACGGLVKWEGVPTTVAAWGDDGIDPLDETGFVNSEVFTWIIWKASTEMEYATTVSYDLSFPSDSLYTANGISALTNMTPGTFLDAQTLMLSTGWNLISTYIAPFNADAINVFAPIVGDVIIVKDGMGNVYWPQWNNLNVIGNLLIGDGYKVKMAASASLTISGTQIIPDITPVFVPIEWSILGYLRTSPAPIDVMLSPIVSEVVIVKNETGQVYWPSMFNLNTIGNMIPGKGYHIKMASGQMLYFPANGLITGGSKSAELAPQNYPTLENTGSDMTIGIPTSAWAIAPQVGDEVAVTNAAGDVIGVGVFNNGPMSITVWGNDELAATGSSVDAGEAMNIKLWHSSNGVEEVLTVTSWEQGSDVYSENGISVVEKFEGFTAVGFQFDLGQNMPNPFAVNTQISFAIPNDAHVHIAVYNVLGESLVELVNETVSAGAHTVEFNAENLPAGTYMYKMVTDDYSATKQMNIIN